MGEVYASNNIQIDGNINIGHGPTGIKAMCRFDINTAYLTKAGKLTDNSSQHPAGIELPEDPARTIDTLIAEINEQGHKLEITASKYNATNINLESTMPGSFVNGIVFTRTGCISTATTGTAQTITQGSVTKGLDEGEASEWELHQNGYPVASRQSNNIYEGVQVFNNVVGFNGSVVMNGGGIKFDTPVSIHRMQQDMQSILGSALLYAKDKFQNIASMQAAVAGFRFVDYGIKELPFQIRVKTAPHYFTDPDIFNESLFEKLDVYLEKYEGGSGNWWQFLYSMPKLKELRFECGPEVKCTANGTFRSISTLKVLKFIGTEITDCQFSNYSSVNNLTTLAVSLPKLNSVYYNNDVLFINSYLDSENILGLFNGRDLDGEHFTGIPDRTDTVNVKPFKLRITAQAASDPAIKQLFGTEEDIVKGNVYIVHGWQVTIDNIKN